MYTFDMKAIGVILFWMGVFLLVARSKTYRQFRAKIPKQVKKLGFIWSALLVVCLLALVILGPLCEVLDVKTVILLFLTIPIFIALTFGGLWDFFLNRKNKNVQ